MPAGTTSMDRKGEGRAPDDARPPRETAEQAYRRIARRKLCERGVPEDAIEAKLEEMVKADMAFRFDLAEILEDRPDSAP